MNAFRDIDIEAIEVSERIDNVDESPGHVGRVVFGDELRSSPVSGEWTASSSEFCSGEKLPSREESQAYRRKTRCSSASPRLD